MKKIIEDKIIKLINNQKNSKYYFIGLKELHRFYKRNLSKLWSFYNFLSLKNLRSDNVQNIYHATVQKAGSQWIKAVFNDKRIKKYTGLISYPQHEYEFGRFRNKFPRYTFVPGLYIPYGLYKEIKKPRRYKTFYVIRDPRNIIVSWYYSMLKTHRPVNDKVIKHRKKLKSMSFEQGIKYCIQVQQLKFSFMRSWIYNSEDCNVLIIKFEDLVESTFEQFRKIFNHCEINIPDSILKEVLKDYTKSKMRQRNLARRENSSSHYRKKGSNWKEVFTDEHKELFYKITGDLIDILSYER